MATEESGAGSKALSRWWGVLLLAIAAAAWWLQPAKTDTGRMGLVERILFPVETNRLEPRRGVVLSADGRVARALSHGEVVRSDDLGATWYRETSADADPDGVPRLWALAQSADGRRVIAVGINGLIVAKLEDGATWVERKSGVKWDFQGVVMSADGQRAMAWDRDERFVRTQDGGVTWALQQAPPRTGASLAADGLTGLLWGKGRLWRTTDGGTSWSDVTMQLDHEVYVQRAAISADGRKAMAVLGDGDLFYSADSGVSWSGRSRLPGTFFVDHVALSADGSRAVIGDTRGTLMTTDAGASWSPLAADANSAGAAFSADGSMAIVLTNPAISTTDGGRTWRDSAPTGRRPALWAVAAGLAGIVLLLTSVWQRWRRTHSDRQDSGTTALAARAEAPARPVRWGWALLLLIAAAAGSWLQPAQLETSATGVVERFLRPTRTSAFRTDNWYFNSVVLSADGRIARAAGRNVILRSDDSGASWRTETSLADRSIRAVAQSADARRAIGVGRAGLILVTADGGATWVERRPPVAWNLDQVAVSADGMRAIASAYRGRATLRSEDGGQTWTNAPAPVGEIALAGDGLVGLITDGFRLERTADAGATWSDVRPRDLTKAGVPMVALSADGRRALGFDGEGHRLSSTDGGITWSRSPQQQVARWANGALSSDGSRAVIAGPGGVHVSSDAGVTWAGVPDTSDSRVVAISADGRTAVVLLSGDVPVISTVDGGATWRRIERGWQPAGWALAAALAGLGLLLVPAWQRSRDQNTGIRDQRVRS